MTLLEKYSWLINQLKTYKRITLRDLQDHWNTSENTGKSLSRATFNRWKEAIELEFGLRIVCDRSGGNHYYLENPEILEDMGEISWVLNSLRLTDTLMNYRSLGTRVVCDPISRGSKHIQPLMQAMRDSEAVRITYVNLVGSVISCRMIPFALRQHKSEWFLLYKNEINRYSILSLTQIKDIKQIKGDKFQISKSFNVHEFFQYYYGVVLGDSDVNPCRIVLRAYGYMINYLRTNPLHSTQEETVLTPYSEFSYYLTPTHDFINTIMGLGTMIEVVAPDYVVAELQAKIESLIKKKSEQKALRICEIHKPLNGNFAAMNIELANSNPSSICEISILIVRNGTITKRFHTLVRPEPFAHADFTTKINDLTAADTANAPSFKEAWSLIESEIADLPLVGYNSSFDEWMLKSCFKAFNMEWPNYNIIDALQASREIFGEDLPTHQLQTVTGKVGSQSTDRKVTSISVCEDIVAIALQIL